MMGSLRCFRYKVQTETVSCVVGRSLDRWLKLMICVSRWWPTLLWNVSSAVARKSLFLHALGNLGWNRVAGLIVGFSAKAFMARCEPKSTIALLLLAVLTL